ncbi:hypothetical protein CWI37_0061p0020 [Hamiltosporidium tvaerminnensis]|uniref:Uncharacterized protein n=1 Tax=Hamiltosporidium tvaerminnensis TaxID=1176355 RepID=A0A4Q9LD93_9MICR|nr:hypothetical protein CWI37_0061p0020 [Hamiltosporidium tvaerminnensis]
MYSKKILQILYDFINNKKSKEIYEMCKYLVQYGTRDHYLKVVIIISTLFRVNICIRIIVDFQALDPVIDSISEHPNNSKSIYSYDGQGDNQTESRPCAPNMSSIPEIKKRLRNFKRTDDSNVPFKKRKLDIIDDLKNKNLGSQTLNLNISEVISSESDMIEKNVKEFAFSIDKNEDNLKIFENINILLSEDPIDIVKFDYPGNFMILSKHFDDLQKTGSYEIKLNIKDITKSNIECVIFKECINILKNGWNNNFNDLNKEEVLDLIWLLDDLSCYSEADTLLLFYRNLLPFIFSYLKDKSYNDVSNVTCTDFISHKKYFLPFIYLLYDSIRVNYNSKNNELTLIEKKHNESIFSFEKHNIDEILIRTTPRALELINQENSKEKSVLLDCIVGSYRIKGIRISGSNTYFTETKDLDFSCNNITKDSTVYEMNTSFISIFSAIEAFKKEEITYIEFERIVVSDKDFSFLKTLKNLESLVLVKCKTPKKKIFLGKLSSYFPKLKNLHIVGYLLQNEIFNELNVMNIVSLELSCCGYRISTVKIKPFKMDVLKEFRMNYSSLNYKIINPMMLSNSLRVIDMRSVDFLRLLNFEVCENWQKCFHSIDLSKCSLNVILLRYFSSDIKAEILILDRFCNKSHLEIILSQKTLHSSTKKLSLSHNLIDNYILFNVSQFEILECLNMSYLINHSINLSCLEYKLKSKLKDINLSGNRFEKEFLDSISQFKTLSKLNISNCNLNSGFMINLCVGSLIASLKKINISENTLCASDIFRLGLFLNLKHLIVSLDGKVISEYIEEYGTLRCQNLETLELINTNVNDGIKNLIISQPLLKNVKLRNCKIEPNLLTLNCNLSPKFFKKGHIRDTKISGS